MKESKVERSLSDLEDRVLVLEQRIFGDELGSRLQQKRQVHPELIQINEQIHRGVSNREVLAKLMKSIEEVMDYLELDENSHVLGDEIKANAILAAEPLIRQVHELYVSRINLEQVQELMNSDAIKNLTTLRGELAKIKVVQRENESKYDALCVKIRGIEEAIYVLMDGFEAEAE